MATRCKGTKRNGERCAAYAVTGSGGYCLTHSPAHTQERLARNRRGGLARTACPRVSGAAVTVEKIADVLRGLNSVILDTWQQENAAPRSRALIAAYVETIKAMQIGDLADRVTRLEQMAAGAKQ
jgi:hypothetical protein